MAELLSGSTPISRANQLLPQFLLYGTGALLVREITRRLGLGWKTIIVLGFTFGFITEGLVLQSIFNPNFLHLDISFGRAWGINWVWTEYLTGLHCFWSITGAIWVSEVIHSKDRHLPWVGLPVLWVCGVIYILMCLALHFLFIKIFGFQTTPVLFLYCALLVIALIVLALKLPRVSANPDQAPDTKPAYSFWVITLITFAAGVCWFLGIHMIMVPGKTSLALAFSAGFLNLLIYFTLINNWGLMAIRTYKDRLAVAAGLLGADLLLGYTGTLSNKLDHYSQIFLILVTLTLLYVLFKRPGKTAPVSKT